MVKNLELVAEIGVNHNGDIDSARHLIDKSFEAGFDTVKVQVFELDELVTADAPLAGYQAGTGHVSQNEMLQGLSLSPREIESLKIHAEDVGIGFLATPFGLNSLRFITESLGIDRVKIGSGDVTFGPLLYQAGALGVDLILSTGMSTIDEIRQALTVFKLGFQGFPEEELNYALVEKTDLQSLFQVVREPKINIMHCTSCYPTDPHSANMAALATIKESFSFSEIGYSDHTLGPTATVMAIAMGASIIEKHVTSDKDLPGPDHLASLNVDQAKEFVSIAKDALAHLGSPIKKMTKCEAETAYAARRSLFVSESSGPSEPVKLDCLRPAEGLSPMHYWDFEGKASETQFIKGQRFVR